MSLSKMMPEEPMPEPPNSADQDDSSSASVPPPEPESVPVCESGKDVAYSKATESIYDSSLIVDSEEYDFVVSKLREFFKGRGFLEAHPQNRP